MSSKLIVKPCLCSDCPGTAARGTTVHTDGSVGRLVAVVNGIDVPVRNCRKCGA